MQLIFYITIYITGVLLGSFFTLATYRIPRGEDITHTRSYCPKCNHRLEFLDLIPIMSYTFLGGCCRYCREKISPRYIIIEAISGIAYLLFIISLKFTIFTLINIPNIIYLIFVTIFFSLIMILIGIEKETSKVPNSIFTFGLILSMLYITYLYVFKINIYRYIICFTIYFILYILNRKKENYPIKMLLTFLIIIIFNMKYAIILFALLLLSTLIYFLKKKNAVLSICAMSLIFITVANLIGINGWCL